MAGNTRRSLRELSAEVATNPKSTAFVELATAYRERGDLQRALWLCLRGLQGHPTHAEAHFELGCIYEARGERELALDEWSIVRQLAPGHLRSRLALIRLYVEEGRRAEAESELKAAEELAPGDRALSDLWARLETIDESAAGDSGGGVFDALVQNSPGTLGVLLVDGDGRVIVGRMPEQGVESDLVLAVNLNSARAEANRVTSYLKLGDLRQMVVESETARLTVSSIGENVIIVATSRDLPVGQAMRVVQRASEVASTYLSVNGR